MFANGCYQSFGDIYKLLHALVPAALILEYYGRIFNLFYRDYQKFAPSIHEKTLGFYAKYEDHPKYRDILARGVDSAEFYLKLHAYCNGLFFHLPIAYSAAVFIVLGEKFLFLNNYLPWTDPSENVGFVLNFALLIIVTPISFLGLLVMDSLFVFYGYQVVSFCDVLCGHLDEIGDGLMKLEIKEKEFEGKKKKLSILKQLEIEKLIEKELKRLEGKFIEVIKEHREFEHFIKEIIFYTEIPTFFTITCNSLSIGICIVAFFKINVVLSIIGREFCN
jgi:hypothetical protein